MASRSPCQTVIKTSGPRKRILVSVDDAQLFGGGVYFVGIEDDERVGKAELVSSGGYR